VQHREGVARAVAEREHDVVGAMRRRRRGVTPRTRRRLDVQVVDPLLEADLAAERDDLARIFSTIAPGGRCRCAAC
jgi:hypothetical protein